LNLVALDAPSRIDLASYMLSGKHEENEMSAKWLLVSKPTGSGSMSINMGNVLYVADEAEGQCSVHFVDGTALALKTSRIDLMLALYAEDDD
jgi:hypothetical protein